MKERLSAIMGVVEIAGVVLSIAFCGVISALDLAGALDGTWLKERIPTFTLLALVILTSYILAERRNKLEAIHNQIQTLSLSTAESTRHIIESLDGVEVISFDNQLSCLQHVNQRLRSPSKRIDDLTWAPASAMSDDLESVTAENLKYRDRMQAVSRKVPYREVFIFNQNRREKLFDRLSTNALGYSCAYYDGPSEVPLLQFMIVDAEEVIVLTGGYSYLAFRHAKLVNLFREYYEDIWRRSKKLKIGKRVYWNEVEKMLGAEKTGVLKAQLTSAVAAD